MVVQLGPGKFYGSSLPRPRFYTDVKLNSERVDPPPSVTDPLMSWAQEAHWSMGGLNVKRHPVRKLGDDFERVTRESGMASSSGGEIGGGAAARTRNWGCCGGCRRRNQKLAAVVEDALIGFGAKVFDDLSRWD
ncbi:hypothetical protein SASPL_107677 [Salvia splendens]|uniref:Uncharacterized protein n=1 Tax=Salvia splendens TaxID=180675 RepID=A0A8X8YCV3_SALSN|nr:hypothetical protein SASPL_107677 [Salvia splendens]